MDFGSASLSDDSRALPERMGQWIRVAQKPVSSVSGWIPWNGLVVFSFWGKSAINPKHAPPHSTYPQATRSLLLTTLLLVSYGT